MALLQENFVSASWATGAYGVPAAELVKLEYRQEADLLVTLSQKSKVKNAMETPAQVNMQPSTSKTHCYYLF